MFHNLNNHPLLLVIYAQIYKYNLIYQFTGLKIF